MLVVCASSVPFFLSQITVVFSLRGLDKELRLSVGNINGFALATDVKVVINALKYG